MKWYLFFFLCCLGSVYSQETQISEDFKDVNDGSSQNMRRKSESDLGSFIPTIEWDPAYPFDEYKVGPGDILNLHVWGSTNLNSKIYVSSFGDLIIPNGGIIHVTGLKLKDVRTKVMKLVRERFKNSKAVIALNSPRKFPVTLTGLAKDPGLKITNQMTRLYDFLNKNKGIAEGGSLLSIKITNDRQKRAVDVPYQAYLLNDDLDGNPYLQEGDKVTIEKRRNLVEIRGLVGRATLFEFEPSTIPLKKVVETFLGGIVQPSSANPVVTISRLTEDDQQMTSVRISWNDFFNKNGAINYENFELKNGDQIYIGEGSGKQLAGSNQVLVTGEVRAPGPQAYRPGASLMSYIAFSGGFASRANSEHIEIYKGSGTKIRASNGVTVEPGDTIFVEEKTFKFWTDHLLILTALLGVVTTTIAINR